MVIGFRNAGRRLRRGGRRLNAVQERKHVAQHILEIGEFRRMIGGGRKRLRWAGAAAAEILGGLSGCVDGCQSGSALAAEAVPSRILCSAAFASDGHEKPTKTALSGLDADSGISAVGSSPDSAISEVNFSHRVRKLRPPRLRCSSGNASRPMECPAYTPGTSWLWERPPEQAWSGASSSRLPAESPQSTRRRPPAERR